MSNIALWPHQLTALDKMRNGCILCGGVGSGKSRTALAYYYLLTGGSKKCLEDSKSDFAPADGKYDLYIITTARKRDDHEWDMECIPFVFPCKVVVDSWNNIQKYKDVKNAFFIFDEQRVVGWGKWSKTFVKISKSNKWILLSATPGDKWEDYIPVFIANGFYKNKREFTEQHMVMVWMHGNYPKLDHYVNIRRLERLRNSILVDMPFDRHTIRHNEDIICGYDRAKYREATKTRWNPYKEEPMAQISDLYGVWRRIVNEDQDRQTRLLEIFESHPKLIVFYNFDYELDILRGIDYGPEVSIAEWNGHKHQPIPDTNRWVYLVQYTAGAEGWNCIKTDSIVFYSQTYSYKILEQATGRIDRLNTPYTDLYYYHLKSKAPIDIRIAKALSDKKDFNERHDYHELFERKY